MIGGGREEMRRGIERELLKMAIYFIFFHIK